MLRKQILTLTSVLALTAGSAALAETVVQTTVVDNQPPVSEDTELVDIMAYDINGDGILAMNEIGEKLFYQFDTDGNQEIDNIEFTEPTFMTFAPMEKTTVTSIDYNNDGIVDAESITFETLMQATGLVRFDDNMNGLSPRDFIETGYEELDVNQDKMIGLDEWKDAYTISRAPESANQKRYNQ